ncbi:peptide chain release factor N(5)-glutamine methyltransferase [Candidatus Margulisiibacteriota bacterium]
MTTIRELFASPLPRIEVEILLAHALELKRIDLYTKYEQTIPSHHLSIFQSLLQRRLQHEPIAYITGYQPFMSLDFEVNQLVLIPRPETEKLVEVVIDTIKESKVRCPMSNVADVGTGSGCIAVSLAKYLPEIKVTGIDSSPESIKIAQRNAQKHGVEDRCQFLTGDMFEPLSSKPDLIISNPPYISTADIETLEPNVRDWEPKQALDGGQDGLDYIRRLIEEGPKYSNCLIFEFGINQAEKIKELAKDKFKNVKIIRDHAEKERIFSGSNT